MNSKIILFALSIFGLSFFSHGLPVYALDMQKITDQINTEMQVQDNGWMKILDHFVESKPYEGWNHELDLGYPFEKKKNKSVRHLHVTIQFLKPCIATRKQSAFEQEEGTSFDEKSEEFREETQYNDYMFYKFRCDYKNKVFVTFFTKEGVGIETRGEYPDAKLIASDSEWYKLDPTMYQTQIFAGDQTSIIFFQIPDNAAHWHVWLAK